MAVFLFYLRLIKIAHFKDLKKKVVEKKIIYGNLGMSIVIFLQVKPMWALLDTSVLWWQPIIEAFGMFLPF